MDYSNDLNLFVFEIYLVINSIREFFYYKSPDPFIDILTRIRIIGNKLN